MSCSICMYLHFFSGLPGALCCLLSFFLLTLFLLGFIESIYFVLKLDGIFKRLTSRVMSLRFPPIQKDRCIRRNSHTEVGAGESGTSLSLKPCCAQSLVKLTFTHTHTHTDLGEVQLVPSEVHSSFSSKVRCSWSSLTAPLVKAGLMMDAANAGPPVVFTICKRGLYSKDQRKRKRRKSTK